MRNLRYFCFLLICCTALTVRAAAPLRVFAAAGTAPAMKEIAAEFTRRTGTVVVFNFANAGTLARQIIAGADFDLFFSANNKWMDTVDERGLINRKTRVALLTDEMVIIVPKGAKAAAEFAKPRANQVFTGRFAIGDKSTLIGLYAEEALTRLGWWAPLQPCLCAGTTVNQVLNYVVLGEADAGVVFRSIAFCAADRVDVVETIPTELHRPVRFPIAAAVSAGPEALQLLQFIKAENVTFKKYGWNLCIPEK